MRLRCPGVGPTKREGSIGWEDRTGSRSPRGCPPAQRARRTGINLVRERMAKPSALMRPAVHKAFYEELRAVGVR